MVSTNNRPLSDRQQQIMGAIVEEHVNTAAPVGSRTVREEYGVRASTATIRNEMVELERRHYVTQPHVSAGRVPLDRGYRIYVDRLMPRVELRDKDLAWARGEFRTAARSRRDICRAAARILSRLAGIPAMVMEASDEPVILREINLEPVSSTVVRMRYEIEPGGEKQVVMATNTPVSADQLTAISDTLTRKFCGRDTGALCTSTADLVTDACKQYSMPADLFSEIKTAIEQSRPQQIYVDGVAHTLSYPEYQEIDKLRPVLEALDEEGILRRLLRPASRSNQIEVTIGHEHEMTALQRCSSIACHYAAKKDGVGAVGVIGPTRIQYAAVLTAVQHLAALISEMLGGGTEPASHS